MLISTYNLQSHSQLLLKYLRQIGKGMQKKYNVHNISISINAQQNLCRIYKNVIPQLRFEHNKVSYKTANITSW